MLNHSPGMVFVDLTSQVRGAFFDAVTIVFFFPDEACLTFTILRDFCMSECSQM